MMLRPWGKATTWSVEDIQATSILLILLLLMMTIVMMVIMMITMMVAMLPKLLATTCESQPNIKSQLQLRSYTFMEVTMI